MSIQLHRALFPREGGCCSIPASDREAPGRGAERSSPCQAAGLLGKGRLGEGRAPSSCFAPKQRGARWPPATPQSCDRASCAPALSCPRASRRLGIQGAPNPLSLLSCPWWLVGGSIPLTETAWQPRWRGTGHAGLDSNGWLKHSG